MERVDSVLVANRGEIARRIIRTVQEMGLRAVAVYSDADQGLPFVSEADAAVALGAAPPSQSYMNVEALMAAAREAGCDAVHPGYGFLSESGDFAGRVVRDGLVWIGPAPETIDAMGDKVNSRNVMARAGVPVAAGSSEPITDVETGLEYAERIGYPLMVKASAGGGGIGMVVVESAAELESAFDRARDQAARVFGSPAMLLERYFPAARHIEVQVLGLGNGRVVALGERDCSVQRRHQKVAEETPSPGIGEELRSSLLDAAVRAAEAIDYMNAGTVEFLVDASGQDFVFLEMNTRLQVEHPVTELVTGLDLVEAQIRIADGSMDVDREFAAPRGHAMEFRIYAEDSRRFMPSPGSLTEWAPPSGEGVRVDAGYAVGNTVSPYYDPLLAKLCVYGADREEALSRARSALGAFRIGAVASNLEFLRELVRDESYCRGEYDTGIVGRMRP